MQEIQFAEWLSTRPAVVKLKNLFLIALCALPATYVPIWIKSILQGTYTTPATISMSDFWFGKSLPNYILTLPDSIFTLAGLVFFTIPAFFIINFVGNRITSFVVNFFHKKHPLLLPNNFAKEPLK